MLCRSLAKSRADPGSDAQKALVAESLKLAKDAVRLDVDDGHAWYQVGTATMSVFFMKGATDKTLLLTGAEGVRKRGKRRTPPARARATRRNTCAIIRTCTSTARWCVGTSSGTAKR